MKSPRAIFAICTLLLCVSSSTAWADPGYRLVPLDDGSHSTMVFDLNRHGEVVGMRSVAGSTHAFRWRAGTFTDLHGSIDPASTYTQAGGINDLSDIVGVDLVGDSFRGFLLHRTEVSPIEVQPGETQVFPFDVNNRGQVIVDSVAGGREDSFLIDSGHVQRLEGLPGETDTLHSVAINERGSIAGYTQTSGGTRAVLWEDGTIMNLGVVAGGDSSFAVDLNDRNQVVGFSNIAGGSHAMRWQNGTMSLLPQLAGEAASSAQSINNWGVIVGNTTILQPQFRSTATLWWGRHVVELDSLVCADDPLKAFVHLEGGEQINDRGDIVASGVDSRNGARTTYFLTLFEN